MRDFKLHCGTLPALLSKMRAVVLSGKSYRLSIEEWSKKRSLPANAQQHVWYKRISDFTGDDIRTAGNGCKLDFGLPILIADNEMGVKTAYILDRINFNLMTREQQINVMDFIKVTSLFTTKQHNQYRDQMQVYWHGQGLLIDYLEQE